MSTNIRYAILGAGAMGSVFGARLHLAGCAVELLNRSPAHSEVIKAQGLVAHLDGVTHRLAIPACPVEQAAVADVVLLFTKTYQMDAALAHVPDTLRDAQVVTLQNGLGNAEVVAARVGMERTVEGVTMLPAEFVRPGEVASSDAAQTWMYHASGQASALVDAIGADFNRAGITTTVTVNVRHFIWQKACFNVAMNALCALTSGSPGLLHVEPDGQALAHEIADETLQVAVALGVAVDGAKVHGLIDFACTKHAWHRPSMLQDLLHERMTEIDALNGYIVRQAEQVGLAVPLNRLLARLVKVRQKAPAFWAEGSVTH